MISKSVRGVRGKKEKLREKIYDLVYGGTLSVDTEYNLEGKKVTCLEGRSELYDKLIDLLEKAGVFLDKEI